MLIFDSKKGRFGTQKPRQWGPLSAVRAAVRDNCEAPLSQGGYALDASLLNLVLPFWENAGFPINYGASPAQISSVAGSFTWANTGIIGPTSNNVVFTFDQKYNSLTLGAPFTFFAQVDNAARGDSDPITLALMSTTTDRNISIGQSADEDYRYNCRWVRVADTAWQTHGAKENSLSLVSSQDLASHQMYCGKTLFKSSATSGDGPYTYDFTKIEIDGIVSGSRGFGVGMLLYSNDSAGQEQIAQMDESPYALLEPRPYRYISIPAGVTSIPTLSSASFAGRVPSVTLGY